MFNWLRNFIPKRFGGLYLRALAGGMPGQWASDHRKESEFFTHWNGVAIHQICLQLMQADVAVYTDNSPAIKRKRRMKVYTTQDESQELDENHELVKLLKRPNVDESGARFRYKAGQQLQLTGTCLIWNVPNQAASVLGMSTGMGKTSQRFIVPTAIAQPVQPSKELPRGGWRIQPTWSNWASDPEGFVEMYGGVTMAFGKVIPTEQMQVIRWPHPLYVDDGCSPSGRGSRWIDGDTQVGIAQWSQLKNGADPSLFVEVPSDVDWNPEIAKTYAEKFAEKYGGPNNVGRVMMTQGKATPISTTPKDMAYLEAHNMYRDAITALHGVPQIDGDSYAAFFAKLKQFTELTVQPILNLLAEEDTEQLAPQFGEGLTVEFTAKTIDDPEVMDRKVTTMVSARCIKVNEVRTMYGLPPIPEGEELAGQAPMATGLNVSGGLNLQGGGMGLKLPSEVTTGQDGAPRLSLGMGEDGASAAPRMSLNGVGKHHTNGRAYP